MRQVHLGPHCTSLQGDCLPGEWSHKSINIYIYTGGRCKSPESKLNLENTDETALPGLGFFGTNRAMHKQLEDLGVIMMVIPGM
jgi:hypothetical protein